MIPSRAPSATLTVLTDYMSVRGPAITEVRAILLVNAIGRLRELGLYEAYARTMTPFHLEAVTQALATSFLPVEHAVAHYEACDQLLITPGQLLEMGANQARRLKDTFLGVTLQRARALGMDGVKPSAARFGRLLDRLFVGGGCSVLDAGPKDLLVELHGFPFAHTRTFQALWVVCAKAMLELFTRAVFVKAVRPREPHAQRLALSASWV